MASPAGPVCRAPPEGRLAPTQTPAPQLDLRCLQPDAGAGEVRLSVVRRAGGAPLMRALVRMPLSEPEEL